MRALVSAALIAVAVLVIWANPNLTRDFISTQFAPAKQFKETGKSGLEAFTLPPLKRPGSTGDPTPPGAGETARIDDGRVRTATPTRDGRESRGDRKGSAQRPSRSATAAPALGAKAVAVQRATGL